MANRNDADINERIRDPQIRLIGEEGEQLGIMSAYDARKIAAEKNLDLVKINPGAAPPVCKIMNYGKFKFEQSKKEKLQKKTQHVSELKEIRLSMTIDIGDVQTKSKHAVKFLNAGDRVKVSIRMRGRQQAHAKLGIEVMDEFFALVESVGIIERKPLVEGRQIIMILAPKAKA